jgi:hypothetical protein
MKFYSVTTVISPYVDFSMVPPDRLQYAAERGKLIHAAAAAHAQGLWVMPLPQDHQGYFDSFRRWFDQYVKQVIWVEKELINTTYGFYGHPDILAVLISGETVLIDYKTPATEQRSWRIQLSAYSHLAKVEKTMALKLDAEGKAARAIVYTNSKLHFAVFLSALNAYRYFKGGE